GERGRRREVTHVGDTATTAGLRSRAHAAGERAATAIRNRAAVLALRRARRGRAHRVGRRHDGAEGLGVAVGIHSDPDDRAAVSRDAVRSGEKPGTGRTWHGVAKRRGHTEARQNPAELGHLAGRPPERGELGTEADEWEPGASDGYGAVSRDPASLAGIPSERTQEADPLR